MDQETEERRLGRARPPGTVAEVIILPRGRSSWEHMQERHVITHGGNKFFVFRDTLSKSHIVSHGMESQGPGVAKGFSSYED